MNSRCSAARVSSIIKRDMEKGFVPNVRTFLFSAALSILLVGCGSLPADKLTAFSTGVTTAKSQTATAFAAVNDLTSEEVIDYAASQPKLLDENFYDVLDSGSIAKWDTAFEALEKYSQSLILLTSPDATKEYKDATVELASQISETGAKLKKEGLISKAPTFSPGFATAFAELGNILLKAKASRDAKKMLREVDPTVQRIFHTMADSIEPIRGTVHSNWVVKKKEKSIEFMGATDQSTKRSIAAGYSELKGKEDAQDRVLASLQRSLRALADAHHALAQDSKFEVVAAVAIVKQEADDTKDIYNRMKTATGSEH